ncbi:ComEA family DNA-binding protein [Flavobacterium sp. JAS]|uniref:ComEA family DNA-binding protein n=1 Tax=Flavobacterium sp. JAS TaxID=2897329 RepID=UPI00351CCDF0
MSFKILSGLFKFTSQQRTGIFLLFILIIVLKVVYFFVDFSLPEKSFPEKEQWVSLQTEIDSLKSIKYNGEPKVYTFNPNFISDYKGDKLGMSIEEIDRLLAFRKQNKYVNSTEEFQQVTKVSDSLLKVISPLFKFPDWTQNKSNFKTEQKEYTEKTYSKKENKIIVLDINQATQDDLIKLYGIGEALSLRILKQKEILGCFVSMNK